MFLWGFFFNFLILIKNKYFALKSLVGDLNISVETYVSTPDSAPPLGPRMCFLSINLTSLTMLPFLDGIHACQMLLANIPFTVHACTQAWLFNYHSSSQTPLWAAHLSGGRSESFNLPCPHSLFSPLDFQSNSGQWVFTTATLTNFHPNCKTD